METTQQQPEKEGKTGLIPNEQLAGSDADKAYDQDGNFPKQTPAEGTEPGASSKGMGSSDTRGEDSADDDDQEGHVET